MVGKAICGLAQVCGGPLEPLSANPSLGSDLKTVACSPCFDINAGPTHTNLSSETASCRAA